MCVCVCVFLCVYVYVCFCCCCLYVLVLHAKRAKEKIIILYLHIPQCKMCIHTKLYSFRFDCKIVSLTAAKTNRIFSVSVLAERKKKHKIKYMKKTKNKMD